MSCLGLLITVGQLSAQERCLGIHLCAGTARACVESGVEAIRHELGGMTLS